MILKQKVKDFKSEQEYKEFVNRHIKNSLNEDLLNHYGCCITSSDGWNLCHRSIDIQIGELEIEILRRMSPYNHEKTREEKV